VNTFAASRRALDWEIYDARLDGGRNEILLGAVGDGRNAAKKLKQVG